MAEKTNNLKLEIPPEKFQNMNELKSYFENLYLGPSKNYVLIFSHEFQKQIDLIFDQLILEHGIMPVFFAYHRKNSPQQN